MKSSLPSVISLQLKILIFGVLCTPVSSWSQSNQAEPLSLDQSYWSLDSFIESEYIIYEELEIFLDQKGNTSFDEIIKNDHLFSRNTTAEHFQPNAVYWAKLKLRGHSEKTANYFFGLSTEYGQGWLKNELWLVHKDSSYVKQQTGFSLLKKEKSVSSIANLARFEIQQNENVTLYIRYEGVLQDPRRIPTQINIGFNNEDVIPGYIEGYPFKGQFMLTPYAPYNYNKIDNIELYQDQSGKASMEDIAGNWDQLDIINTYNSNLEMDQVYWIKATFFGSPEFNGEQIFSTNFDYNNDFNFIDAYILNRNGNTVHQRTGHHIPLKERPYEFWGNFIKLDINLQDTIDLFIRLEGANPKSYHEDIFSNTCRWYFSFFRIK